MSNNAVILFDLSSLQSTSNSPKSLTIGIDLCEIDLPDNYYDFRGFLQVSLRGAHLLYWNTEMHGRCARFIDWEHEKYAAKAEDCLGGMSEEQKESIGVPEYFLVLQWHDDELQFVDPSHDTFKMTVNRFMRMEFVGKMTSYEHRNEWSILSSHISWSTLRRLRPPQSSWMESDLLNEEKAYMEKHQQQSIPKSNTSSIFTHIPRSIRDASLTPAQLTQLNFDKSLLIQRLIRDSYDNNAKELLGELQYSYISFLIGHCYDALQQWQQMFTLLCQCNSAVQNGDMEAFWMECTLVMHHQVNVLPPDVIEENQSSGNFLFDALCQFFDLIDLTSTHVAQQMISLKKLCESKFGCTFDSQEEFAPIYCEGVEDDVDLKAIEE